MTHGRIESSFRQKYIDVNLPATANNVTKTILIFVYHSIIGPVHVEVNKKIITKK